MNSNVLKIIACISMLIDHAGLMLFPNALALRCIGRLAMPIFAYFIGQGCIHTRSIPKYFLRVFAVGALCQLVYALDSIFFESDEPVYINIMLVFSVSIIMCGLFISAKKALCLCDRQSTIKYIALFSSVAVLFVLSVGFCSQTKAIFHREYIIDYSYLGVFLPLLAIISEKKPINISAFSIGLVVYCFIYCQDLPYVWFSLLCIPLILLYNGNRGRLNLKYLFYIFYPAHIAVLYLISIF